MKWVLATLLAAVSVTSAAAADLPAPVYTKAPVVADPGYNWTGFYAGANLGYSWGRSSGTSVFGNGAGTALFSSSGSSSLNGIVGGGQAGYNWQIGSWLWGFEADIQGTGEHGSRDFTCPSGVCRTFIGGIALPSPAVSASLAQGIDWFGTVRARAGVLATPRLLIYATGGVAYGDVGSSVTLSTPNAFSTTSNLFGYAVGAGIEGAIGGRWTAKLEYLYVNLGNASATFTTTSFATGGGFLTSSFNSRVTDNILRAGVNYRFE
jgi:outer membrane immunogenic protein